MISCPPQLSEALAKLAGLLSDKLASKETPKRELSLPLYALVFSQPCFMLPRPTASVSIYLSLSIYLSPSPATTSVLCMLAVKSVILHALRILCRASATNSVLCRRALVEAVSASCDAESFGTDFASQEYVLWSNGVKFLVNLIIKDGLRAKVEGKPPVILPCLHVRFPLFCCSLFLPNTLHNMWYTLFLEEEQEEEEEEARKVLTFSSSLPIVNRIAALYLLA